MNGLVDPGAGGTEPVEGRCPVCGSGLKPGEGVTAEWQGRVLRFRCLGCLARFEADPGPYLAGHTDPCGVDDELGRVKPGNELRRAVAAWRAIASGASPAPPRGDSGVDLAVDRQSAMTRVRGSGRGRKSS